MGIVQKMKIDHTIKWYLHNTKSVLENKTHKLLWDYEIQTDHLMSTRRQDLIIINKKKRTWKTVDLVFLADHWVKLKENKKKNEYVPEPCQGIEKNMEHESDGETEYLLIAVQTNAIRTNYVKAK